MPFRIIRNDITKVEADAIVDTANPKPVIGAGTDWAIHSEAGPELLRARERLGELRVGESAATPAFGLPAKYVLHTVSPVWIDGKHGEEELLRQAYDAALSLADRLGCQSVAFPLMAAGTYAFPHDRALAVALGAFTDFLMEHEMQIDLVLFNAKAFGLAGSLFDDLKSYIDDNYVNEHREKEYRTEENAAFPAPRRPDGRWETGRRYEQQSSLSLFDIDIAEESPDTNAFEGTFGTDDIGFSYGAPAPAMAPAPAARPEAVFSLKDIFRQRETTFSEHLLDLLRERDGKDSEVYKRAEISRQLFSRILCNKDYQPTKNTAIQLALGLQLDLRQTQKLLGKAGFALTRSSKADLVVQYYIERGIYSVTFINEALLDCGLPLLKTGLKA